VYRRSLSSSLERWKPKFSSIRDNARTPPSTFLFLHLHLSNSPGSLGPHPSTSGRFPQTSSDDK